MTLYCVLWCKLEERCLEGNDTDIQAKHHRPGHTQERTAKRACDSCPTQSEQSKAECARLGSHDCHPYFLPLLSCRSIRILHHELMSKQFLAYHEYTRGASNFELNESRVKAVFSQFGVNKCISMSVVPSTIRRNGFCFIESESPGAAHMAVDTMQEVDIGGR
ncbi:hypothetical protein BX666DRAFT_690242 [Dichotomocladium elegans]|nr:hypothetical protein BX666DRAFT_690242 [Dichotomocladium elegans]